MVILFVLRPSRIMGKVKKIEKRKTRLSSSSLFIKECKCSFHTVFSEVSGVSFIRLHKVTSKDYNKNSLKWLIKNGYLSERNKHFCNDCLKYAENKLNESNGTTNVENQEGLENSQSNSDSENETIGNSVAYVLKLLKENKLNETETIELRRALGQLLNKSVYEDCKSIQISKQYTLFGENLDTKQFLSQRPKPLISFITEVTSDSKKKFDYRKEYRIRLAIEQLYFVRHFVFIGPFSFAQGLVKWSFSGSKAAHALDGGTTSSGSITTMRNLSCQLATEPNACFANGDVDVFADNTQRTGKTSRVKENGTAPLSVATNVVFIQSNPPTEFQSISRLCPSIWEKPCIEGTDHQVSNLEETINRDIFTPYRQKCLEELIFTARSELKVEGESNYVYFITKSIKSNNELTVFCCKCSSEYNKSVKCSTVSGNNPINFVSRENLYGDIPN